MFKYDSLQQSLVLLHTYIVAPFDCEWLKDKLHGDYCCIVFEVAGDNDATIILKRTPGSRRQQHRSTDAEQNCSYIVIFGSHMNKCLSIEKNGSKRVYLDEPWTHISPKCYRKFWMVYNAGTMYFGTGEPSMDIRYTWVDKDPLDGICCVGLSTWDSVCSYRNVCMLPWKPRHLVPALRDIAIRTLCENMNLTTACHVMLTLDRLDLSRTEELERNAISVVAKNLEVLVNELPHAFYNLSSNTVSSLLSSPELSMNEKRIVECVIAWMFYGNVEQFPDVARRQGAELLCVLDHVRLATVDRKHLMALTVKEEVMVSAEFSAAIQQALFDQEKAIDGRLNPATIDKYWPRFDPSSHYSEYQYDGDKNGAIRFIATDGEQSVWRNPMCTGKIRVMASSPTCKQTDPKAIVGLTIPGTNYAGRERGRNWSWWVVDLKEYRLVCTYYTLHSDKTTNLTSSYNFEASDDGQDWTILCRPSNNGRLCTRSGFLSTPIYCCTRPYRMFRLLLTSPQEQQDEPYKMHLGSFELYGMLSGGGLTHPSV